MIDLSRPHLQIFGAVALNNFLQTPPCQTNVSLRVGVKPETGSEISDRAQIPRDSVQRLWTIIND